MKQSLIKLNESENKFLIALLRDGHKSDAEIAGEIKMSKSSIHRIREKMEHEGIIADYIPVIDLDKVDINVFFVILFEWQSFEDDVLTGKSFEDIQKDDHIVFFGNGEGSEGHTNVLFMGFRDVYEFNLYFKAFRKKYGRSVGRIMSFMLPSKEILKNDFTGLARAAIQNLKVLN